ncbi:hypothetical protein U27_01899 [Candidatus Vecturithrix granuli]|uniref:HTH marR-type domain-containing protein n=1 Tax=Vecturithrix granuli TaxID=1499967 RepID=A0A0S6W9G8_VECG1|nr:hypothetical protein U27_01899 [Candidatus Vecturithrix granuli]
MPGFYEHLLDELDSQGPQDGFSSVDLLNFPPAIASLMGRIMRKNGMTFAEISDELQLSSEMTQKILDALLLKGFLRQVPDPQDNIVYKTKFTPKTRRRDPHPRGQSFLDDLMKE